MTGDDNTYELNELAARRFLECIKAVRTLGNLSSSALQILATVAVEPGISMSELEKKANVSQASCSRNVALLSEIHRLGKPGLGLIVATEDPIFRRRKVVKLTEKGQRVLAAIVDPVR